MLQALLLFRQWTVQVRLTTGPCAGKDVCVPRINLTTPDTPDLHIRFTRRQLPLRAAYCMTINKAQGQTFQSDHLQLFCFRCCCTTLSWEHHLPCDHLPFRHLCPRFTF